MTSGAEATRRHRWLVWSVLALVYVVSYFHRIAPAVLAKDLMASFAASGSQVATMAALYLYAFAAMQIPAGVLMDTWGPRRTVTAGAFVMSAGAALFAASRALPGAYAARVVVGVGASVVFIGTLKIVSRWFVPAEFATLSGLTQVAGNAGGLLAATPLALAVAAVGWRATLSGVAALSIAFGFLCLRVVRDRPEDAGLPRLPGVPPESGGRVRVREGLRTVLGNRRTWPMFFVFFGQYGTVMAFSGLWGVPWLRDVHGLPPAAAANVMAALTAGVIVGAPLVGVLSDRFLRRRKAPYVAGSLVYAGVWAALAFSPAGPPAGLLVPFGFLFGVTAASYSMVWVCAREVNPSRYSGLATATVNAGGFLGAAIMQNVLGRVLDARWLGVVEAGARRYPPEAYRAAFVVCFVSAATAALITLFVTETHARPLAD